MDFQIAPWALLVLLIGASPTWAATSQTEQASEIDVYQALRNRCADAGEESWVRCQRIAVNKSISLRRECDENQERARRVCMLKVMEKQNRDIQGVTP